MGLALPVAAPIHQAVGGGSVNCVLPFPPLTELKHSIYPPRLRGHDTGGQPCLSASSRAMEMK